MNDFPEISADVSPGIHPSALAPQRKALATGQDSLGNATYNPIIAAAEEGLSTAYEFLATVATAERLVDGLGDPAGRRQVGNAATGEIRSQTWGAVHLDRGKLRKVGEGDQELADATDAAFQRVASTLDKRRAEVVKGIAFLEGKVAEALNPPSRKTQEAVQVEAQIRSHIASLGSKAGGFVLDRIRAKDITTAAAVLHAPAYLSGLKDADMPKYRQLAAATFAPDETRQLEAANKLSDALMQAGAAALAKNMEVARRRTSNRSEVKKTLKKLGGVG